MPMSPLDLEDENSFSSFKPFSYSVLLSPTILAF
jgi:hypothetical protein